MLQLALTAQHRGGDHPGKRAVSRFKLGHAGPVRKLAPELIEGFPVEQNAGDEMHGELACGKALRHPSGFRIAARLSLSRHRAVRSLRVAVGSGATGRLPFFAGPVITLFPDRLPEHTKAEPDLQ
jgi:hypothetical protein